MKWFSVFAVLALAFACQTPEATPELRSQTWLLHRAGYNPISGTVKVTELAPGKLEFDIQLKNTAEGNYHPAHLHFGSISEVGDLAVRLNDVDGATGNSLTIIDQARMEDGSLLTYDLLMEMNGSVKIHQNDSFFKFYVLSFGNIGKNENYLFDGVTVCTGH